jgi:hypothetical protein
MTTDPNDPERIDREIRINELKHAAEEAAGGEMVAWESEDCPPEVAERFWEQVLAFEEAPETTHAEQLRQAGVELPPAEGMSEEQLTAKLWEVIHALARQAVYLHSTDHLSDRELYKRLAEDVLHERTTVPPPELGMRCHIDLVGTGSDEHIYLQLKYYADEDERRRWVRDFPDYVLPDHEDPPHDRDRHLPPAPGW